MLLKFPKVCVYIAYAYEAFFEILNSNLEGRSYDFNIPVYVTYNKGNDKLTA